MTRSRRARFRDRVALAVAGTLLVWSLVRPTVREADRSGRIERVAVDVTALVAAVEAYVEEHGQAPTGSEAGQAPAALAPWLRGAVPFAGDGYRLDLDRWAEVVVPPPPVAVDPADSVPAPTPFEVVRPAVTVHSGRPDLLAHMLETYGPARSFVRDTSWTLVLDPVMPTDVP